MSCSKGEIGLFIAKVVLTEGLFSAEETKYRPKVVTDMMKLRFSPDLTITQIEGKRNSGPKIETSLALGSK